MLLNTDIETLSHYLLPTFLADLNKYSADKIVEMYGTHVLTNITIGGTYTAYYKSVIVEENSRVEKTKSVSAGAKFNLCKIGLDANGSWNRTEITEANKKNSNWECNIKAVGGSTSGTSITLSPGQGSTYTIDLGAWSASVDDEHSKLVDVDWNATYPIYDLISNPAKKAELKNAVERYIDSKKIEILPLVPLYQYWNGQDHYYTTAYIPEGIHGWTYEYPCCYVLDKKVGNAVPFHQYLNGLYHFYTRAYLPEGIDGTWNYECIACYVYDNQEENTIPLHQYLNGWWVHLYDPGYYPEGIEEGWKYEYISCYVYPR